MRCQKSLLDMITVFDNKNSILCLFLSLADLAGRRQGSLIYLLSNLWTPIMQYSSWGQIYLPSWCQMALILHSGAQPAKQNCKEPMSLTFGTTQVQRPCCQGLKFPRNASIVCYKANRFNDYVSKGTSLLRNIHVYI
jgi:hypothetical protein